MPSTPTPDSCSRVVALASLAGCKILPTPTEEDKAAAAAAGLQSGQDGRGDVGVQGDALSQEQGRAVRRMCSALAKADAEGGRREIRQSRRSRRIRPGPMSRRSKARSSPPTRSRARRRSMSMSTATARPTVRVQIGPAMRGTALRDALDFVDFNAFKNQIDFAQFGKSFNTYANTTVLSKLPREGARRQDRQAARRLCAGLGHGPAADDAGRSRDRRHDERQRTTSSSSWRTSRRSISARSRSSAPISRCGAARSTCWSARTAPASRR